MRRPSTRTRACLQGGHVSKTTAPSYGTSAGSADHIADWKVGNKSWRAAAATAEPGLIVVGACSGAGLFAVLSPILGLAIAPFLIGGGVLALLWFQNRQFAGLENERDTSDELVAIVEGSTGTGLWDWDVESGRIFWSAGASRAHPDDRRAGLGSHCPRPIRSFTRPKYRSLSAFA